MRRVLQFLYQEILWGKMAGIAALAALASFLLEGSPGALAFLQGLSLFVFAVAGMFVYRSARRHPFWNALVCAFFAALFYVAFFQVSSLGEEGSMRPLAEIALWFPYMLILITVETFVGTGVFFLARRFAERAQARQEEKAAPPAQTREAGRSGKKEAAPPPKEVPRSGKAPPRLGGKPPRRPGK